LIKRLYHYVGEYKKYLGIIPFVVLVEVLCELSIPLLMAKVIDVGIPGEDIATLPRLACT
jgi:ATP-binding cassette subfamily B protein